MHLSASPTDEQIVAFVEAWIDDLARGDYRAAYSRTAHDPYYAWTPDLIRAVIEGYGLPEPRRDGKIFQVTERRSAKGTCHYRTVDRENIPSSVIADVWHDLPLNGEWSDLTATFRIERGESGCVVTLQEIHVF
jgi:hypothetical protein